MAMRPHDTGHDVVYSPDYSGELVRLREVAAAIRNWHRPVTAGANHYDGGLRRHCSECRHPWPCRTYQLTEKAK